MWMQVDIPEVPQHLMPGSRVEIAYPDGKWFVAKVKQEMETQLESRMFVVEYEDLYNNNSTKHTEIVSMLRIRPHPPPFPQPEEPIETDTILDLMQNV